MIVYGVYFIDKKGFTISKTFQSLEPDDKIIGGIFTALQGMTSEFLSKDDSINVIHLNNVFYHIRSFGVFNTVIVTNSPHSPDNTLETLGFKFLKLFNEDNIKTEKIELFKDSIPAILKNHGFSIDETNSVTPAEKLTTGVIYNLPKELKKVALAVLTLNEGSIHDISEETGFSKDVTKFKLEELLKQGYLGKKLINKNEVYFCSI